MTVLVAYCLCAELGDENIVTLCYTIASCFPTGIQIDVAGNMRPLRSRWRIKRTNQWGKKQIIKSDESKHEDRQGRSRLCYRAHALNLFLAFENLCSRLWWAQVIITKIATLHCWLMREILELQPAKRSEFFCVLFFSLCAKAICLAQSDGLSVWSK